ncbi:MAG: helix-turn-helix domain-containing protein [Cyanobacteriota bacterium]|nr:helix-turn-helix domain-containing protein [Cyanobacteriota bacterium]
MPPKARLKTHLTNEEIKNCYLKAPDTTEARRWHLVLLITRDWSIKKAAEIVGLSYDYAKEIVSRYNKEGPISMKNGSKNRQPPPSKPLLDPSQQKELSEALRGPAPDGGNWSGPKVARWIAEKTGRDRVWPQRGWEYLKRLKMAPARDNKLKE